MEVKPNHQPSLAPLSGVPSAEVAFDLDGNDSDARIGRLCPPGHTDGKLSGFVMSQDGSHAVVRNYSWQAFPRSTAVSAICSTPWGDLWSGNTRGSIRSLPNTLQEYLNGPMHWCVGHFFVCACTRASADV